MLTSVASGLTGAGLAACGSSAAEETKKPAFVLVHGSWHNASTYTLVIQQLAQLGHVAVALDLPGHGLDARLPARWHRRPFDATAFATEVSPVAATTQADHAARTIAVIDRVPALWLADPAEIGAMRIDFDSPNLAYQAKSKQAFYADVSDDAFAAMGSMLAPDDAAAPTATRSSRSRRAWPSCSHRSHCPDVKRANHGSGHPTRPSA